MGQLMAELCVFHGNYRLLVGICLLSLSLGILLGWLIFSGPRARGIESEIRRILKRKFIGTGSARYQFLVTVFFREGAEATYHRFEVRETAESI